MIPADDNHLGFDISRYGRHSPESDEIMYVCLCKGITDGQIKDAVYGGATSLRQVRKELGVSTQCGKCGMMAKQIIDETLGRNADMSSADSLYYAIA